MKVFKTKGCPQGKFSLHKKKSLVKSETILAEL